MSNESKGENEQDDATLQQFRQIMMENEVLAKENRLLFRPYEPFCFS